MHNNGLFVPTSGKDQTIIHKNVSYKFEVGKPNEFVTTELIVNLLPDLIILIENTIESKPLVDIAYIEEIAWRRHLTSKTWQPLHALLPITAATR